MITFKTLTIKNFLSFGNNKTTINLDTNNISLIVGKNMDIGKEGYSKNGVGKSSVFQAIVFALYGQGLSNIKIDDFINVINRGKLLVELTFTVNNDVYVITRGRKPNIIELLKNEVSATLHSTKSIDQAIVEIIGLDYDSFVNSVILSNSAQNFMLLKPAEQKVFIENLLSIDLLTKRANSIKEESKENSINIRLEDQNKQNIESNNARISNTIKTLSTKISTWDDERNNNINLYLNKLNNISNIDCEAGIEIVKKIDTLEKTHSKHLVEIERASINLDNKESKILELEKQRRALQNGVCPFCSQPHVDDNKLEKIKTDILKIKSDIEKIQSDIIPILENDEEVTKVLEDIKTNNPKLLSERDYINIKNEIKNLTDKINELNSNVENPYVEQLELLKQDIKEYDSFNLDQMKLLDKHYDVLVKLLTDKKSFIRKSIIDQYIPFINKKLNEYIEQLASQHKVKINNDLTVDIYLGKNITFSYGNLSAGERLRVNFAINLAFRDFISVTKNKISILCIDELFDSGADNEFLFSAIHLLKKMKESIFLISHREELLSEVDNVITIVKNKGFSSLE